VRPVPLVLSSPSGGGKTTIARALLAAREDLGYSVSATTRAMRPGEQDGVDYFFLQRRDFEQRVKDGLFVEWAEYGGNLYGTLKDQVQEVIDAGRHVVLDVEIQGARAMRKLFPESVLVFILPPSAQELMQRLGGTSGSRAANLGRRLRHAVEELGAAPEYDYVVFNTDRFAAVAEVAAILDSECRRPARNPGLRKQLEELKQDIAELAEKHDTPRGS
jgi:guanylate kinase